MSFARPADSPDAVRFTAADGVVLTGHLWPAQGPARAQVILNPATGVLARYYHRYAGFLAQHGFDVLSWDYRGIGLSRPQSLRGCSYRWRDWGMLDFEAALQLMIPRGGPVMVVGHSIGGFLPGLSPSAPAITRMLTMGAQYAWRGDYAPGHRLRLMLKWHLAMPALTLACGYFPGKRLGWLEDLPKGVALEWARRGPDFAGSHPRPERDAIRARMAAVRAEILSVAMSDDDLGTLPALRRALSHYHGAGRQLVHLTPAQYGRDRIGHFNLFHDSHRDGFWRESLIWLTQGQNPWAAQTVAL